MNYKKLPIGRNLDSSQTISEDEDEIITLTQTLSTEDAVENGEGIVATCDGNLNMVVYIPSSVGLEFSSDFSAGKCDRTNPAVYLDTWNKYDSRMTINLKECHPNFGEIEGSKSITHFNQQIQVIWHERVADSDDEFVEVTVFPKCMFTNDYIVDKLFSSTESQTTAVIGTETAHIPDNLQFTLNFFEDENYETPVSMNIVDPRQKAYVELAFTSGFNPWSMISVPTACYILVDNGDAHKIFSLVDDSQNDIDSSQDILLSKEKVCEFQKIMNPIYGTWKFAIDVPNVAGPIPLTNTANNYKVECAVKVCPNFRHNLCEPLIHECNYESTNFVDL